MKKNNSLSSVKNLTLLALMTALVAVFQLIATFVPLGFHVGAFALIPIIIGAAMLGPWAGAWLGLVFGIVILLTGAATPFFVMGVIQTVLVVLVKGAAAGFVSGLLYQLIAKKNSLVAIVVAALACPIFNTAIFVLACFTIFFPGISEWASGAGKDMIAYVFLIQVGANFFVELGICAVVSPIAHRLVTIGRKMRHDKSYL